MSNSENENNDTETDSQEILTNESGSAPDTPVETPVVDIPQVPVHSEALHVDTPADSAVNSEAEALKEKLDSLTRDYKRLQVATEENIPVELLPDTANDDVLRDYVRRLRLFAEESRHTGHIDRVQQASTMAAPQTVRDVSKTIFDVLRKAK